MTGTNKKAGAGEVQVASDKQKALIVKLYKELKFPAMQQFSLDELQKLDKPIAEEHIDYLIRCRREQQNGNGERVNGFDKISFSMIYKLCWRELQSDLNRHRVKMSFFNEWVYEEYIAFQQCKAYTKEKVAEGGQK